MTITEETKTEPIVEVSAPPIAPADPMAAILKGMLDMQAKTNETLEKVVDKLDGMAEQKTGQEEGLKSEEDMKKSLNNIKIIERKMYKVLLIKQVLNMDSQDQQLHGDNFANG
jgi:CRISPR/Cas system-associated endonuclease Cas3-HD